MAVIETSGLTKRFGETLAVDRLSLTVERGQTFGFLGPNGSGKTTTIGMLTGILRPTAGTYRLFGTGPGEGLDRVRRRVGATLEQPNFYPYLSGRQNLALVAEVKGAEGREVDEALDRVGLARRKDDKFKAYSLGMKQRLALAGTMLGEPDLIILDEPANGLDPEGMREIRRIIQRLGEGGTTIFLSSHLLWEVERTCTHVAVLDRGAVVRSGRVEDVIGGGPVAALGAEDPDRLLEAARDYPGAAAARREGDRVFVELEEDEDLASLNRWMADRGVHLSHLSRERRSLEEAFLELTGVDEPGMGEVA